MKCKDKKGNIYKCEPSGYMAHSSHTPVNYYWVHGMGVFGKRAFDRMFEII